MRRLPAEHAAVLGIRTAAAGTRVVAGAGVPQDLVALLDAQPADDVVGAAAASGDDVLIVLPAAGAAGVRALLDEPRVARATVLLLGTGERAAREALEALDWGAWPRVRFVDLEHVSPRIVEEGRGHERLEGGLGLIVLDAEAATGWTAPRPPYLPVARALPGLRSAALAPRIAAQELEALRAELEEERARRVRADEVIAELKASPSWQVTAPLRAAKHAVQQRRA